MTGGAMGLLSDISRFVVIADFLVMFLCGVALHAEFGSHVPRPLRRAAVPFGLVALMVCVAVTINALSPIPPTPGVMFLAVPASLAAIAVAVITVDAFRRR